MQIYLMRHGEAVSASTWRGKDDDRPLTPVGLAKLEAGVMDMHRAGFSVPHLMASPFVRAKETAVLTSKLLSIPSFVVASQLSSGATIESLRKFVLSNADKSPFLLVGHMPEFAIFGSRIASEPRLLDGGLAPGDMLALETGDLEKGWGAGTLLWWRTLEDWKKVLK